MADNCMLHVHVDKANKQCLMYSKILLLLLPWWVGDRAAGALSATAAGVGHRSSPPPVAVPDAAVPFRNRRGAAAAEAVPHCIYGCGPDSAYCLPVQVTVVKPDRTLGVPLYASAYSSDLSSFPEASSCSTLNFPFELSRYETLVDHALFKSYRTVRSWHFAL